MKGGTSIDNTCEEEVDNPPLDDKENGADEELGWGCNDDGGASAGGGHRRLLHVCCGRTPRRPASHFRGKLEMALRTALSAGAAALVSLLFWAWAGEDISWFTVVLCIIRTRSTLGESLRVACDSWHGTALTVPLAAILGLVHHHTALLLLGLFLAVALLVLNPRLPDGGKRLAVILLCIVVLNPVEPDEYGRFTYLHTLSLLLVCLAMADLFMLVALLAPLPAPALALLDARGRVAALRRGLAAIVEGCGRAFDLGEAVHFSTLEQLLEEATQAFSAIATALPSLRWEMALLHQPPSAARQAHKRLAAYLDVVEQQLEIMGGALLSLRRIGPNATHREFAKYLRQPLNDMLHAWVAVSNIAAIRVDKELRLCWCWGGGPRRRAAGGGKREGGEGGAGASAAAAAAADHDDDGDDLRGLLVTVKSRHETFMHELLKARLIIFFGFMMGEGQAPAADNGTVHHADANGTGPALVDMSAPATTPSASGRPSSPLYYYMHPPSSPPRPLAEEFRRSTASSIFEDAEPHATVVLTRRETSDEVYRRFQRDYARLGAFALLPRNTFLLDVNLLVGTLPALVGATSAVEEATTPLSWSGWARHRLACWRRLLRRGGSGGGGGSKGNTSNGDGTEQGQHDTAASASPSPFPTPLFRRLLLPVKAAVAVVLASLGFFLGGHDMGAKTPWAAIAVAYSISSHPGSSFRSACSRVQGTVVGGVAGMGALKWLGATSPPAQVAVIALWTFACAWHRSSALYGDAAIVAAFTLPIIMLGPILGEPGAMLRVEQTVLGAVIYAGVDNLFLPVRAKCDLRAELAAAFGTLKELWARSFSIFLQRTPEPLEEAARAQALHERLQASFASQERYIRLALDEPELWHRPFEAPAYRKMVDALSQTSLFLAMLVRASNAFPLELAERDRSYHAELLRAVADVAEATGRALEQAQESVRGLTSTKRRRRWSLGGSGNAAAVRRMKRVVRSQACALLRLDEQYTSLRDFIDTLMVEQIQTKRTSEGEEATAIVSPRFILCISGMLFSLDGLGRALLRVGHALRELVEREIGSRGL